MSTSVCRYGRLSCHVDRVVCHQGWDPAPGEGHHPGQIRRPENLSNFRRYFSPSAVSTAGHDTTSFALSGGLEALLRHREQVKELQADPGVVGNAAEEIRWISPVRHFLQWHQSLRRRVLGDRLPLLAALGPATAIPSPVPTVAAVRGRHHVLHLRAPRAGGRGVGGVT